MEEIFALLKNQSKYNAVSEGSQVTKKKIAQMPMEKGIVIKDISNTANNDRLVTRS